MALTKFLTCSKIFLFFIMLVPTKNSLIPQSYKNLMSALLLMPLSDIMIFEPE